MLHLRRPERSLPPELDGLVREGEAICALADTLAAEFTGSAYFVVVLQALDEGLAAVLYPSIDVGELRGLRRRGRPLGAHLDREPGIRVS